MQATEAINKLIIKLSLKLLEQNLSESVANFKGQNQIFGEPLTFDGFLNPIKEKENLDMVTVVFKDDMAIIAGVHCQGAVQNGNIFEVDSDDDNDGDSTQWQS